MIVADYVDLVRAWEDRERMENARHGIITEKPAGSLRDYMAARASATKT